MTANEKTALRLIKAVRYRNKTHKCLTEALNSNFDIQDLNLYTANYMEANNTVKMLVHDILSDEESADV